MTEKEKGVVEPKIDNKNSNCKVAGPLVKSPKEQNPTLKLFVSILTTAVTFILIWSVAVGLGGVVTWTDVNCSWVSDDMIKMGKALELILFLADATCLTVGVIKHVWAFITGRH